MKDSVGEHIVFKSRSPSVAWRSHDEHFSPKTSGSMFDILAEFNNERYNRGEHPDECWIKLEKIQTRAWIIGGEIAPDMMVTKFLASLPAEYTHLKDNVRMASVVFPEQIRATIKDKYLSSVKVGDSKGSDHNRALFTSKKKYCSV